MKVRLETPRLVLREFTEAEAAALFELDSDPEVMRYIGPYQLGDVEAYRSASRRSISLIMRNIRATASLRPWRRRAERSWAGFCCGRPWSTPSRRRRVFGPRTWKLGYRFRRAAWGQGYTTEGSGAPGP